MDLVQCRQRGGDYCQLAVQGCECSCIGCHTDTRVSSLHGNDFLAGKPCQLGKVRLSQASIEATLAELATETLADQLAIHVLHT
ncbi:hypothetical protein NS2R_01830 [Pseudomonas oryzihabitans]|nr:hypothetical protein NS2R_01830 [Pseudomonas psychrotolerans]